MVDIITLSNFSVYAGFAIQGLFTGLGAAIGSYIAMNHIIGKSRKLFKRLRKKR